MEGQGQGGKERLTDRHRKGGGGGEGREGWSSFVPWLSLSFSFSRFKFAHVEKEWEMRLGREKTWGRRRQLRE